MCRFKRYCLVINAYSSAFIRLFIVMAGDNPSLQKHLQQLVYVRVSACLQQLVYVRASACLTPSSGPSP